MTFSFLIITTLHSTFFFFFFNDTATTEIYTLSLHDALPIYPPRDSRPDRIAAHPRRSRRLRQRLFARRIPESRSEEHTSELQSQSNLVCRLLLEKKKKNYKYVYHATYKRVSVSNTEQVNSDD